MSIYNIYPTTTSNIGAFVSQLGSLAQEAGNALGVSPTTILAQWGLESGYGAAPNAVAANNFAGIMVPGSSNPQVLQTFPDLQSFEQAYVNTLQHYPGALNTGSDIGAFVGGLTSDPNHLYTTTDPTTYANSLSGVAANLPSLSDAGTPGNPTSGLASSLTPTGSGTSQGAQDALSGIGHIFTWIYDNPLSAMVLVVVGLAAVGIIVSTVWNSGKAIAVKV